MVKRRPLRRKIPSAMYVVPIITEGSTMINEETRRKLREMSLEEMITVLDMQSADPTYAGLPFDERIKMLVDYIYQEKYNGKVKRPVSYTHLRAHETRHDLV